MDANILQSTQTLHATARTNLDQSPRVEKRKAMFWLCDVSLKLRGQKGQLLLNLVVFHRRILVRYHQCVTVSCKRLKLCFQIGNALPRTRKWEDRPGKMCAVSQSRHARSRHSLTIKQNPYPKANTKQHGPALF